MAGRLSGMADSLREAVGQFQIAQSDTALKRAA
jgi:hypothetical protein